MKRLILSAVAAAALTIGSLTAVPVSAAEDIWTKGEVTKIDKELGKVTVRHEEIKNLDMPGMRMIFRVTDPKMLEALKVGQKGEFHFIDENGRMMIKKVR